MNSVYDRVWSAINTQTFDAFWVQVKNEAWCKFRDAVFWPVCDRVRAQVEVHVKDRMFVEQVDRSLF
jgi:hypothetical protein